jgi:hypothetical protein
MAITLSPDDMKSLQHGAIADAQTCFSARVLDLEGVCHEPEFSYWKSRG